VALLEAENLTKTFGVPLMVHQDGDRFFARRS